ncbi:MAG: hypothetical protein EA349_02140 [Halomonadaceae bacterium]|nr:MAG: hypothetical protein EA349_02140 [Halomonadaceae bacterium]
MLFLVRCRLLLPLLALLLLVGCAATPSPEAQAIQDAQSQDVAECQRVARVYGTAEGFFLSEAAALTQAQNEALERAVSVNATHVVWINVEEGLTSYVSGDAYRC